jgi:mono/diheme cytochrome c family protein
MFAPRWLALVGCMWIAGGASAGEPDFPAEQVAFFEKQVRPILAERCHKCHGPAKAKGGLRLTDRAAVLAGGDTGPAAVPGKSAESLLVKAIGYAGDLQMPPSGKLPQAEIDILVRWVEAGLPSTPGGAGVVAKPAPHAPPRSDGKSYWAYQPVRRPAVPAPANPSWIKTPVDAFVSAGLAAHGLSPNPPAERVALIRRLTYDLTGLPPTPAEVDAFTADQSPAAWERLVDRLLASPHYGEKWGRHWLDVVRFAETNGYERDGPKPFAWRYRDYVIRSFNADKPYDLFIKEQLAGDELPNAGVDGIIATGFYRLGLWDDEPVDPQQALFDGYDDLATTVGQAFLGMTLNCARCHDHKGDPLPQTDYYRLVAFFRDIRPFSDTRDTRSRFNLTDISPPEKRRVYEEELNRRQARLDELRRRMKPVEDAAIAKMPPEDQLKVQDGKRAEVLKKVPQFLDGTTRDEYLALARALEDIRKKPKPAQDWALSVNNCDPRPPATHVLIRGNPHAPAAEVNCGFPAVLGAADPVIPVPDGGAKTSGRRRFLADWVASPDNPLTARVMVNRIWQGHFGRGVVASCNDFGRFGDPPTHPALLDWLADEFVRGGWSVKRLHKLILTSNAYQMSARANDAGLKADPLNIHLWRFNMRRLQAEEVRDSVLAASGRLNLAQFGPSVYPPLPKEVLAGQSMPGDGWHPSPPDQSNRRSVYVHVKRSLQLPLLATHDQADTDTSCPVRYTTTVPTQALGMLNGAFMNEQATAMAERLRKESPDDVPAQVGRAIRLTTGRVPPDQEVARDAAFVRAESLERYCLMLLNANEFVYVD